MVVYYIIITRYIHALVLISIIQAGSILESVLKILLSHFHMGTVHLVHVAYM